MEQAEHELLRQLGTSVVLRDEDGEISWPRVAAACDFRNPARFEEVLDIEVTIERLGRKSVTYGFRFIRQDIEIATGTLTTVCCRIRPGHAPEAMPIPIWFADKLQRGLPGSAGLTAS